MIVLKKKMKMRNDGSVTRGLLKSMERQKGKRKKKRKPFPCLLAELFQCFYLYNVDLRIEEASSNTALLVHRRQFHNGKPTV